MEETWKLLWLYDTPPSCSIAGSHFGLSLSFFCISQQSLLYPSIFFCLNQQLSNCLPTQDIISWMWIQLLPVLAERVVYIERVPAFQTRISSNLENKWCKLFQSAAFALVQDHLFFFLMYGFIFCKEHLKQKRLGGKKTGPSLVVCFQQL